MGLERWCTRIRCGSVLYSAAILLKVNWNKVPVSTSSNRLKCTLQRA